MVNSRITEGNFLDGMSNTLAFAEVKAYQPKLANSSTPATLGVAPPNSPAVVLGFGGTLGLTGHTEWVDARVHQTGFTTTFSPNQMVPYQDNGITYSIDFNSMREGRNAMLPTYAVVTSRSYHSGGVNSLLMDGSVRFVDESTTPEVRAALVTRAGQESSHAIE